MERTPAHLRNGVVGLVAPQFGQQAANNIGSAAGACVAGLLIDRGSISVGFAAGGVILGLTSALIWLTHRSIEAKSCTCEAA